MNSAGRAKPHTQQLWQLFQYSLTDAGCNASRPPCCESLWSHNTVPKHSTSQATPPHPRPKKTLADTISTASCASPANPSRCWLYSVRICSPLSLPFDKLPLKLCHCSPGVDASRPPCCTDSSYSWCKSTFAWPSVASQASRVLAGTFLPTESGTTQQEQ
jgi:hypothetical protein